MQHTYERREMRTEVKPEGKRPLADITQEDNITMHLKEVCRENVIN